MFQFRGFPTHTYWFSIRSMILHHGCSHIRKSADRSLFAAPRSLSQLVTSFFGSWCQGIRSVLLFAWTSIEYPLRYSLVLSSLNCCVSRFTVTLAFSKIVYLYYPTYWKDLIFKSSSFPFVCLLSLFVYLILAFLFSFQWSIQGLSLALSSIFIGLFSSLSSLKILKNSVNFLGGLKWTRTTDLALIRRAL